MNTKTVFTITGAFASLALANNPAIIPCTSGAGPSNGCGGCSNASAITLSSWDSAKIQTGFSLSGAQAKTGGGYDVWWSIGQPDPGCKVIITEPTTQDKPKDRTSGNVVMTASHAGCYFAHIGSEGFAAGFCCGDGDCQYAGAETASAPSKRDALVKPRSSILERRQAFANANVKRQSVTWGNAPPPPPPPPSAPAGPDVTCSAPQPTGEPYTRAGDQQIISSNLRCYGAEVCSQNQAGEVSASSSLMSESSTQITDSQGKSLSVSAGFFFLEGPTGSVTAGVSEDWAKAVTTTTSETTENSVSKTISQTIDQEPGTIANMWFTPALNCQSLTMSCNGQPVTVEKCDPKLDGNKNPIGESGLMFVG